MAPFAERQHLALSFDIASGAASADGRGLYLRFCCFWRLRCARRERR